MVSDPVMIVRRLLERGCDPHSRTPPTRADNLDRVVYTPEALAQKVGPQFHGAYLQLLKDLNLEVADDLGLADDGSDEEYLECV